MKKFSILLIGCLCVAITCAIWSMDSRELTCDIKDLSLKVEDIPPSEITWIDPDDDLYPSFQLLQDSAGADRAYMSIFQSDCCKYDFGIAHTIYPYRSKLSAMVYRWVEREHFFPTGYTEWGEVEEAKDWPLHADEQAIFCTRKTDYKHMCAAVVRYGAYVSDLSTPTDKISRRQLRELVLTIDKKFSRCMK